MPYRIYGLPACLILGISFYAWGGEIKLNDRVFHLPDGFTIELVAGPPLVDRPITADFDEMGRLYVSDSSGSTANVQKQLVEKPHRILRLEDSDGDGKFDKRTIFADHMMFPEGTMWRDGSLYVAAAPSIWKLTNTNGDGVADERSEWFLGKTLTGCANDLHGPYAGPDGWIYWCKGAFAKQTYTISGKEWSTRAAHIFRSRADGSGIEPLMTGGMDNPVEVVFTAGGERIFTTTFLQNPANGRRDGLIHAVYGGVYGKVHDVIDDQVRTGPDLMPVLAHLGPAASCGLVRYESAIFGKDYQDNLFSTSFNLHKVFRHVLTPEGATFACKTEDFLTSDSLDFHPTHLIEDADGSLIVVDTGGWYKLCCPTSQIGKPDVFGAIYRVRRADARQVADARGLKIEWAKLSVEELGKLLGDERIAVQKRAMSLLAARPAGEALAAIRGVLKEDGKGAGRLNAIWTACRIDEGGARAVVRDYMMDLSPNVRDAAIHSVSVWRDRDAVEQLFAPLSCTVPRTRRVAAEALGRMGDVRAVEPILRVLGTPTKSFDQVLDHSLVYALIEIGSSAEADQKYWKIVSDDASTPAVRRAALVVLDQTHSPLLGSLKPEEATPIIGLLQADDQRLRESAAWVISHHPAWGPALAKTYREMLLMPGDHADELQKQLAGLCKSADIQEMLADLAGDATVDVSVRRNVVAIMSQAPLAKLPEVWNQALLKLLGNNDWQIADSAVAAFGRMGPKKPSDEQVAALLKLAARSNVPANTRLRALATLPAAGSKEGAAIPSLSQDLFIFVFARLIEPQTPAQTRLAAAEVLGRSRLSNELLLKLAGAGESAGPLEIDRILPAFSQEAANDAVGEKLLDGLEKSKSLAAVRADTLRAATKHFGAPVQQRVESLLARLTPDAAKNKARLDQLLANQKDGDIRRGQLVFNSAKAACSSCHTIGYVGGKVGPDLTKVGAIRTERDLLESIVFPSSSFVQSFEPIIVETNDGDVKSGILKKNDNDEVLLVTGPEQEVRISRKEIKSMRPGALSVMPAGLDQQLSAQDLTDLVAFLKACK